MICLADNDLLIELGAWNLLSEFQAFLQKRFGIAKSEIYILGDLVRRLRKEDSRWERQYGKAALERVARFCEDLPSVYDLPHESSAVEELGDVEHIDTGEAVLVAVAVHYPDSLILTNELKFLAALSDPTCASYHSELQGRILHLRQIVYLFLQEKGFRVMESRITLAPTSDIRIFNAFQQNASYAQKAMREAVEEAERMARGMLVTMEEP